MKARKVITLVGGVASLIASACDDANNTPDSTAQRPVAPDNTARNNADPPGAKTPIDQSQSGSDITIAAEIRKAIMSDGEMSSNAQNCKVIVENGAVTLRGVVATQVEKASVEAKARAVTGVSAVDNQLEVKN